jgi:hypothetical protein
MSGIVSDNIDRQSGVIAEAAGGAEVRSDDPSASAGTVWFNTTSGVLKVFRLVGAWSTEATITVAKGGGMGFGVPTAALIAGGTSDQSNFLGTSYEYNGSSWSNGGALANVGLEGLCFGTLAAAYTHGGYNSHSGSGGFHQNSEEYDGTSWSSSDDYTDDIKNNAGAFGTQTAGASAGQRDTGNTVDTGMREYNGSSWSAESNRNNAVYDASCSGTQTAGLSAGGKNSSNAKQNHGEEYDGTSWSNEGDLATARAYEGTGTCGTQSSALTVGGQPASGTIATVEVYNGSTWSAGTSIANPTYQAQTAAVSGTDFQYMGGNLANSSITTANYQFSESVTARTITDS